MTQKQRFHIFNRYKGICLYCKTFIPFEYGTIEHIIPKSRDGSNNNSNLAYACERCNQLRGTKVVASVIKTREVVHATKKKTLVKVIEIKSRS